MRLSKFLSYISRHAAQKKGLKVFDGVLICVCMSVFVWVVFVFSSIKWLGSVI